MPNIEIKACLKNYNDTKKYALENFLKGNVEKQTDTYFLTKKGLLKYREISSSDKNMDQSYLIPYIRDLITGPKKSSYTFLESKDPELAKELLMKILGVDVIVEKTREIFFYENVRIHLDNVNFLGHFIEFEAIYENENERIFQEKKVHYLMSLFNVNNDDLIVGSYHDLLKEHFKI